jgi:glutamate 5-kinase
VNRQVSKYASTIPGFLGKGGMASKVKAGQKVSLGSVPTITANGLTPGIIKHIFEGEEIGTLFMPRPASLCSHKHWIVFTKSPKGEIFIDKGASDAPVYKGKSLLPSGIRNIRGRFSLGDSVVRIGEDNTDIAVGMVNDHSGYIRKIMGCKISEIESKLGFKRDDEVINRDNLVLADQMEDGEDFCQLRT